MFFARRLSRRLRLRRLRRLRYAACRRCCLPPDTDYADVYHYMLMRKAMRGAGAREQAAQRCCAARRGRH